MVSASLPKYIGLTGVPLLESYLYEFYLFIYDTIVGCFWLR